MKTMALTFAIGATVASTFNSAMKQSTQRLQQFSQATSAISAKKDVFKSAFTSGAISTRQYAAQLNGVYSQVNKVIAAQNAYKTAVKEKADTWKSLAVDTGSQSALPMRRATH